MAGNQEANLERIREAHAEQVFELYAGKSKSFRNAFSVLFGFALVFLFVILIPYVSIKANNDRIGRRLKVLPAEIALLEQRSEPYRKAQEGIDKLQSQIEQGPRLLRRYIDTLGEAAADPFARDESSAAAAVVQDDLQRQGPQPSPDPCLTATLLSGEIPQQEWWNCRVVVWVESRFAEYQTLMLQVVTPLKGLDDEVVLLIDLAALERGLEELQATFATTLAENTDFWETVSGKEAFFVELEAQVDRFWRRDGASVVEQERRLRNELGQLQAAQVELEQQQTRLQSQEEQIAGRLEQIEFPFGKLPIGLYEAVSLFPVLLAIGFVVAISPLLEGIRLRRTFHTLHQQKDPGQNVLTDEQIALIAPLWIDPVDTRQNKVLQFGALLVPLVIFAAACGLILYSWTIPDRFVVVAAVNRWVYGGLYLLSLGFFVYGYRLIVSELRRYAGGEV